MGDPLNTSPTHGPDNVMSDTIDDAPEDVLGYGRDDDPATFAIRVVCDRLADRTASLFVGAGVNAGITNGAGERMPLGGDLAHWIARDLLGDASDTLDLEDAAEMARERVGSAAVNTYLYERFQSFRPGAAHRALIQLPWDTVYTTNYDLLIEEAASDPAVKPAGIIRPIYSSATPVTDLAETDIPYYKLHGSVDAANTPEGRLVLTREDYRYYEEHRRDLFARLSHDLQRRTLVFVGYSLRDPNFRAILDDCRRALGLTKLPLSFAVWHDVPAQLETFWRSKYNVQLVATDAGGFMEALRGAWETQHRVVVPLASRSVMQYVSLDPTTHFPKIGDTFYRITPSDIMGASSPAAFFHGAEPTWADVRDRVAPPRDGQSKLATALAREASDSTTPASLYVVTGAAGTGKTTAVRGAVFDLLLDTTAVVVGHIPGTPLALRDLIEVVDANPDARIAVLIRHASQYVAEITRLVSEARRRGLPVTVVAEDRQNLWTVATEGSLPTRDVDPVTITLGRLSEPEIERILDALDRHGQLGRLAGAPRDVQVDHFRRLADKELIVALRQLTTEGEFDDIVRDEYRTIPSAIAQQVYAHVAALGQVDLAVRYEVLMKALRLRHDRLAREVFRPTEAVLLTGEATGRSRHNLGYTLRTRHPLIASIIFADAAPDDAAKFEILNALLTHLDRGFPDDARVLDALVRRRDLTTVFASPDNRRAIYDRLAAILPGNPYVLQHRSLLERELGDPLQAVHFARRALALDPVNHALQNTLGNALEVQSRTAEPALGDRLRAEAAALFAAGIRDNPRSPYGYLGQVALLRQHLDGNPAAEQRATIQRDILQCLQSAYDATDESPKIGSALGDFLASLGDPAEADRMLSDALAQQPADSRTRDALIRLKLDQGHFDDALQLATVGLQYAPAAWRLHRHAARAATRLGRPAPDIRQHYEAAMRHKAGDLALSVEYGAFLFVRGYYAEAQSVFAQTRAMRRPSTEKNRIREWWRESNGAKARFAGKVHTITAPAATVLAKPQGFSAFFWLTSDGVDDDLSVGDPVVFTVGFNAHGPHAAEVQRASPRALRA